MSEDKQPDAALTYQPVEVALVHEHRILVRGPYNTAFIARAKKLLHGEWDPKEALWVFPGEREAEVRQLCSTWFGSDGSSPPDLVDVHLAFHESFFQDGIEATIFGRVIVNSRGRAATIRVGEGVALIEGEAFSEAVGTGRRIVVAAGSRVRMVAVPRALAEEQAPPGIEVSIIERPNSEADTCKRREEPDPTPAPAPDAGRPALGG
jgi:hypothetical protein